MKKTGSEFSRIANNEFLSVDVRVKTIDFIRLRLSELDRLERLGADKIKIKIFTRSILDILQSIKEELRLYPDAYFSYKTFINNTWDELNCKLLFLDKGDTCVS